MKAFLYAFGDDADPLPETVRVLDEIVTDFIIETCHQAARSATYSNRQKIKVDDFKFAIRHNEFMLGRVQELLGLDKELKEARRQIMDDLAEGKANVEKAKEEGKPKAKRGRKPKNRDQTVQQQNEGEADE